MSNEKSNSKFVTIHIHYVDGSVDTFTRETTKLQWGIKFRNRKEKEFFVMNNNKENDDLGEACIIVLANVKKITVNEKDRLMVFNELG